AESQIILERPRRSYFASAHRDHPQSRSRSRSNSRGRSIRSRSSSTHSRPRSFPDHPDDYNNYYPPAHTMPPLPSRSPRRTPRQSGEYQTSYNDNPFHRDSVPPIYPQSASFDPTNPAHYPPNAFPGANRPPSPPYTSKSIVGDNGYPHHNVPRRRSGGEYDYAQNGVMGPKATRRPARREGGGSRMSSEEESAGSDESWRVSHGMPGGWSRPGGGARFSGGLESPVSPIGSDGMGSGGRMRRSMQGGGYYGDQRGVGQAM
ncbi:uncharacterized protein AB675_11650, partial [Cyphellophora attinorum]